MAEYKRVLARLGVHRSLIGKIVLYLKQIGAVLSQFDPFRIELLAADQFARPARAWASSAMPFMEDVMRKQGSPRSTGCHFC